MSKMVSIEVCDLCSWARRVIRSFGDNVGTCPICRTEMQKHKVTRKRWKQWESDRINVYYGPVNNAIFNRRGFDWKYADEVARYGEAVYYVVYDEYMSSWELQMHLPGETLVYRVAARDDMEYVGISTLGYAKIAKDWSGNNKGEVAVWVKIGEFIARYRKYLLQSEQKGPNGTKFRIMATYSYVNSYAEKEGIIDFLKFSTGAYAVTFSVDAPSAAMLHRRRGRTDCTTGAMFMRGAYDMVREFNTLVNDSRIYMLMQEERKGRGGLWFRYNDYTFRLKQMGLTEDDDLPF